MPGGLLDPGADGETLGCFPPSSPQAPLTMIVVTANWEIADGSLWPSPTARIMTGFRAELTRAAVRAGWQSDGRYDPVPRVDVVFAGDTFDWLASREWLGSSRPWQRGGKARAIRERVMAGTLRVGRSLIRGMLAMVRHGVDVARADRHGRPVHGATLSVPVGLSILEGNLDAGLSHEASRTSAKRPGIGVGSAWSARGIRVIHGDTSDPLWMVDRASGGPSLGESLRVDLLTRFAASAPIGAIDPDARRPLLASLRAADPLGLADAVAAWCTASHDAAMAGRVHDEWLRSVSAWHRAARSSGLTGAGPWNEASFDVVDALAGRLAAIDRRASARRDASGVADHLADLFGGDLPIATVGSGSGFLVLGHASVDAPTPLGGHRMIGLGARRGVDLGRDRGLSGVCEISPLPSTPRSPATALFTDRGAGTMEVSSLGDPVAEWSENGSERGWSPTRADLGAWIVDAA